MSALNRSLLFLLGLVLGLLAGAGFFIFKMDDMLKNGNLFSAYKDTLIIRQQQVINGTEDKKSKTDIKKHIGQKDTAPKSMTSAKSITSAELLAQKYSREVPIKKVMAEADSLLSEGVFSEKDTSSVSVNQNTPGGYQEEVLVIRKDELLGARNVEVINLQQNESANFLDSLLEKVSGIKDGTKNIFASFRLEFWQSPVNYKGYKMTKNKIVLFGINPEDNVKLFHLDDHVFMKHIQSYYKLYFTDDFKQFEKVSAPSIIAKLEK